MELRLLAGIEPISYQVENTDNLGHFANPALNSYNGMNDNTITAVTSTIHLLQQPPQLSPPGSTTGELSWLECVSWQPHKQLHCGQAVGTGAAVH